MSILRVLVCFLVVLLCCGGTLTTSTVASPPRQPIFLYEGQVDRNFLWSNSPKQATVFVFREEVPEDEKGGRVLGRTIEKVKPQLTDQVNQYVETTVLTIRPHPEYGGESISTKAEYPSEGVRYFLLIKTDSGLYSTRTIGSTLGK